MCDGFAWAAWGRRQRLGRQFLTAERFALGVESGVCGEVGVVGPRSGCGCELKLRRRARRDDKSLLIRMITRLSSHCAVTPLFVPTQAVAWSCVVAVRSGGPRALQKSKQSPQLRWRAKTREPHGANRT